MLLTYIVNIVIFIINVLFCSEIEFTRPFTSGLSLPFQSNRRLPVEDTHTY